MDRPTYLAILNTQLAFYRDWRLDLACGSCTSQHATIPIAPICRRWPALRVGDALKMMRCRRVDIPRARGCGARAGYAALIDPEGKRTVLLDRISPERLRPVYLHDVELPIQPIRDL